VRGKIWCGDRLLMTGSGVFKGLRNIKRTPGDRQARQA
jgi:hypothetical protein